jgi:hypothetical protein
MGHVALTAIGVMLLAPLVAGAPPQAGAPGVPGSGPGAPTDSYTIPTARSSVPIVGFSDGRELPGTAELGLLAPEALALNHRGDVIIADTGNDRVLTVSVGGVTIQEFGGYGWEEDRFDTPSDVSVYEGFFTYVLDEGNRRVASYDVQGDYVGLVVREDEAGTPVSIDVGPSGGLYLVDSDSQSVIKYSQFDEVLQPVGRFGLDAGGLLDPSDVAVGPGREIAVADRGRPSVEVFDEFGSRLYSVTTPDTMLPNDVTFDEKGNLLVVDGRHNRLLAFPRGGSTPSASLNGPSGFHYTALAVRRGGSLAVLDGEAGRVRLFELVYDSGSPNR